MSENGGEDVAGDPTAAEETRIAWEAIRRHRLQRMREEIAKTMFLHLMTAPDTGALTYDDAACQAITAADEFLARLYAEPTAIPPYEA